MFNPWDPSTLFHRRWRQKLLESTTMSSTYNARIKWLFRQYSSGATLTTYSPIFWNFLLKERNQERAIWWRCMTATCISPYQSGWRRLDSRKQPTCCCCVGDIVAKELRVPQQSYLWYVVIEVQPLSRLPSSERLSSPSSLPHSEVWEEPADPAVTSGDEHTAPCDTSSTQHFLSSVDRLLA